MMLTCHEAQELVPELLSARLSVDEERVLRIHLKECPSCAAEVEALSQTWAALDAWPEEVPPGRVVSTIRQFVVADLTQEEKVLGEQGILPEKKLVWAVMDGLLFALGSVVVMAGAASLEGFSAPVLLSSGALWSALYILTFALYFRSKGHNGSPVNLRVVATAGLLTMALSLVAARTLSVETLVRHCELSPWGAAALSRLGQQGAYLVLGAFYALVPLLIVSFAFGEGVKKRPMVHGLLCAGLFFLLTLPAIYLQCGAFSLGVGLSWIAGAFLGSLVGAPLGFWLRAQIRWQVR